MTLALDPPTTTPPRSPALTQLRSQATWQDYIAIRDDRTCDWQKLAFHQGWLWVDMGKEEPNHARFSDLITAVFFLWALIHPEIIIESFGRCLIEKPNTQGCAPDLVLYRGKPIPKWQPGEPRLIDLRRDRQPDLVGEISDTTLSFDLDEQKQLYASLGIPEYWVIDVKGLRIFAFGLTETGTYQPIETSQILQGLPIALIEQTLERLATETDTKAANWFMQQLQAKIE